VVGTLWKSSLIIIEMVDYQSNDGTTLNKKLHLYEIKQEVAINDI